MNNKGLRQLKYRYYVTKESTQGILVGAVNNVIMQMLHWSYPSLRVVCLSLHCQIFQVEQSLMVDNHSKSTFGGLANDLLSPLWVSEICAFDLLTYKVATLDSN